MKQNIFWLKLSLMVGAVLDLISAIFLAFPESGQYIYGIENFNPAPEYKFGFYIAAALMAGWTVLLVWAYLKPVQRKGIAIMTIIPVIIGIALSHLYIYCSGIVSIDKVIPTWCVNVILTVLFTVGYLQGKKAEKTQ